MMCAPGGDSLHSGRQWRETPACRLPFMRRLPFCGKRPCVSASGQNVRPINQRRPPPSEGACHLKTLRCGEKPMADARLGAYLLEGSLADVLPGTAYPQKPALSDSGGNVTRCTISN